MFKVVVALLIGCALSTNEVSDVHNEADIQSMGELFARSEEAHRASMDAISATMTVPSALELLKKRNLTAPVLALVTDIAQHKNLRKQPKGYAGLDGARKLLNSMIYESLSKYDTEIAKCTDFYSKQCAAMEVCRGQIAASNFIAANSRTLILDAQATINKCEVDIPETKYELKLHNEKCKSELKKLNTRLKIVSGDIAVITKILTMTDCDANKKLLQTENLALMHCKDSCTQKSFITSSNERLKQQLSQLKSSVAHNLLLENTADLFDGITSLQSTEVVQSPVVNKTEFNNPPVPMTEVPINPCTDPNQGAPSMEDKRAAKCVLSPGQCYKLQERFLLIQGGIQDEEADLLQEIELLEHYCEETKNTLETEIENDEDMLANAQTKLGFATEKEATAGETARQTAIMNEELNDALVKQMKTCSDNYIGFEGELCALKKIRGELYKMKGDGHSGLFTDCEVSEWDPEECTKTCAKDGTGGEQKLTRSVLTHPDGGTKCLPLSAMKSCNNQPCPVNCKLSVWSGWSKCSAFCGSGVQQRVREVEVAMRHGGAPCGETSDTKACNVQACEKDCKLSRWTKWSTCSKDCDGGTKKRMKFVKTPAEGEGKCPGKWDKARLEFADCNMKRCKLESTSTVLKCNRTFDIVLLVDGSGSLGKRGWAAEVKAANTFVDALTGTNGQAQLAVILYSGPRTWSGVRKCFAKSGKKVDIEKVCNIKTVTHFEKDMKKVKGLVNAMKWPRGSTLTSMALLRAKAELGLGRGSAHSIVIAITDGRPLSFRNTLLASRSVRKSARLIWVPVTKYAPLKQIKKWATRRWQENLIKVNSFGALEKPEVITHLVAAFCPKKDIEIEFGRK